MRTTKRRETEKDSSEPRLDDIIDRKHGLSRLNATIDWRLLEGRLGGGAATASPQGRPSQSRLFIGLALLRDLYELTDDVLLARWIENPYFQLICGESRFQHALPAERSVLTAALRRLTAEKLKTLLRAGLGNAASFDLAMLPELERLGILRKAASAAPVKRRDGDKPVSIYDVAKRAGVSIKTVSLVINRQPNVSLATRTAVLAAIEALAYKPNVFARGLASERSYLIGLLHDVAPGSYIADLQLGALARCRDEGYHLVVELLNPLQDHDVAQRVRSLVSESVLHGVILTPPLCDDVTIMEELAAARTPFVRVAPGNRIPGTTYVNIDEYKAAYEMTAYLIGLGHRRIGFVKGKPDHGAARLRFDGYRKALTDGGLSVTEEYCAQGYFTYQSGLEAGEKLLALKNRPTAIFAGNDDMAAGVLSASYRFNLAVPTDLSIAGFDDSIVAQVVWPRLTTCRQPIKDMAAAAVSILAQRRDKPLERQLAHEVVVRESTAPPPG